ncbi:hypothetical protein [Undibacterium sp. YM2]|jgi:hypothetical protein|uniref:hypothetical protein n=1 Tax=Undibacterium sp. YM2 TaxID=2058625 RepID=UPI0013899810|nr:hypothetical protein [Undibacterium sp. YM2]
MKTMTCRKIMLAGAACAALFMTGQSQAQDVGVSMQFGQPGFYGRVDIGNFPQPQVIYTEPRIVQRVNVVQQPMYLVVPPGHRNKWEKHCYRYNACNRPVYFVQENWYNTQVVPRYRDGYYRDHDYRHDAYRRDDYRRDDYRKDDRRYDEHERHGHGRGREHPEH